MTTVTLVTTLGDDHRLVVDVPSELPAGRVELVIRSLEENTSEGHSLTREEARAKLLAAGALSTAHHPPEGYVPPSKEESDRLDNLFTGPRLSSELIDEDRGTC